MTQGNSMEVSLSKSSKYRRLMTASVIWGLIAVVITLAAFFATLQGFSHLTGFQIAWIALAGVAAMAYTAYCAFSAAKASATIDQVDQTVADLDTRAKNQEIALIAHTFSILSTVWRRLLDEHAFFEKAVDILIDALHIAIWQCHGLDQRKIRVSLIQVKPGEPTSLGILSDPDVTIRSAPRTNVPELDSTDEIREELRAVMSRSHPYHHGWLWDDRDPPRAEYHVLAPKERGFSSYIRVGVPGVGVICIESSDHAGHLGPEDRDLALAFGNMLAIWREFLKNGEEGTPL